MHSERNPKSVQKGKPTDDRPFKRVESLPWHQYYMMSYHHLPHIDLYWSGSNAESVAKSLSLLASYMRCVSIICRYNSQVDSKNK